jgi:hypothetical protein
MIRHDTVHVLTVRNSARQSIADEMAGDGVDEGADSVR